MTSLPSRRKSILFLILTAFGFPSILKESQTVTNWLAIAYLGVFQIGLAFIFFTKGIKYIPTLLKSSVGIFLPR